MPCKPLRNLGFQESTFASLRTESDCFAEVFATGSSFARLALHQEKTNSPTKARKEPRAMRRGALHHGSAPTYASSSSARAKGGCHGEEKGLISAIPPLPEVNECPRIQFIPVAGFHPQTVTLAHNHFLAE